MTQTIVALYDEIDVARQVVEDLVNSGFSRNSISLITNDSQNTYSRYLDSDYKSREEAVTASEGAGFGAVVGALTGVLAGLAALTIPGIGLVIVADPLVAGLTGIVAGAVTGGIVSTLVTGGVPEDKAPYYAEGIRRGGTLVSVESSDVLRAEHIMNRYGSINIHERMNVWREDGWNAFNTEHDAMNLASEELSTSVPPRIPTPTMLITHVTPEDSLNLSDTGHMVEGIDSEKNLDVEDDNSDASSVISVADAERVDDYNLSILEEDLRQEYEYTDDDLQPIEPIKDYPEE